MPKAHTGADGGTGNGRRKGAALYAAGSCMVLDMVIELVAQQMQMDADDITESTSFEEIGADEMDIADLVMAVEDAFDTDISIDEANAIETVSDLVDLAERAIRPEDAQ